MNFGDILNAWESGRYERAKNRENNKDSMLDEWLGDDVLWTQYGDKDAADDEENPADARSRLKRMAPEAEIDLHGMVTDEALDALGKFLREASFRGLRKVLVIHGKGNHSKKEAVLPDIVKGFLQESKYAGEIGIPDRYAGGKGATWVIIKPQPVVNRAAKNSLGS